MTLSKAWYPETRWLVVGGILAAAFWGANGLVRLGYAVSDIHTKACQVALDSALTVNAGLLARPAERFPPRGAR